MKARAGQSCFLCVRNRNFQSIQPKMIDGCDVPELAFDVSRSIRYLSDMFVRPLNDSSNWQCYCVS